jgi:hypothetical protein
MATNDLSHKDINKKDINMSTSVSPSKALEDFRCVQNRILLLAIKYLPSILLFVSVADILMSGITHLLYISWILAVAISLIMFNMLMNKIPEAVYSLWKRRIIAPKGEAKFKALNSEDATLKKEIFNTDSPGLDAEYAGFIRRFEAQMNHSVYQYIFGIFFFLLLFLSRPVFEFSKWLHPDFGPILVYQAGGFPALFEGLNLYLGEYMIKSTTEDLPAFWASMTVEPFLGLIIGLVTWRMFTTGLEIRRLGKQFDFMPQMMHPDGCGGLEMLGTLCLYNALIISVWGIFLGGWIILGPFSPEGSFYTPLFTKLLPVPMAASVICFFLPLWDIHRVMASKAAMAQEYLGPLEERINRMAQDVLDHSDGTSLNETEQLAKGIELMQQFHHEVHHYPVWPFDKETLTILITSQAIQILGLVGLGTSIASNLRDLIIQR